MNPTEMRSLSHAIAGYALAKPHTQTDTGEPLTTFGFRVTVVLRGSIEDFLVDLTRGRTKRLVARFGVPEQSRSAGWRVTPASLKPTMCLAAAWPSLTSS